MMTDQQSTAGDASDGATHDDSATNGATHTTSDQVLTALQTQMDKRFEGLADKLWQKFEEKTTSPKKSEPAPSKQDSNGHGGDAILDGIKFGELRAKLPDAARERIDGILKSRGIQHALEAAELLMSLGGDSAGNGQAAGASPIPPGQASSPASNASPQYPKTVAEYIALRQKARTDQKAMERWEALDADPNFNPETLSHR